MSKKLLPFFLLLFTTTTVFSKGHPAGIELYYKGENVLFYTPGYYTINGQVVTYTDTLSQYISRNDSIKILAMGSSTDWIQYLRIYRNDTLVYEKTGDAFGMSAYMKKPGKYLVKTYNGFPYPEVKIAFELKLETLNIENPGQEMVSRLRDEVKLYPNPCGNNLVLSAGDHNLEGILCIVDMQGKRVWNENNFNLASGAQYIISTIGWPAGVYFIQVFNGSETQRFKIIKN